MEIFAFVVVKNFSIEGLFFVEKIGEKLLNDELNIEHKGIIKSFTKLLSILEKTQPLCSHLNTELTESLPLTDHNEKWNIKTKNEVTNRSISILLYFVLHQYRIMDQHNSTKKILMVHIYSL